MTTNVILGLLLIAAATIILADRLWYLIWRVIRFQRRRRFEVKGWRITSL